MVVLLRHPKQLLHGGIADLVVIALKLILTQRGQWLVANVFTRLFKTFPVTLIGFC